MDFLIKTLDATERARVPHESGAIMHGEVLIGNRILMCFDACEGWPDTPAFLMIYVDDCDAAHARMLAAGATEVTPLATNDGITGVGSFAGIRRIGVNPRVIGDKWERYCREFVQIGATLLPIVFKQEQEQLMSELKIGDVAPDFALPADTGETVRLSDFRGKRVILYFYPLDDSGGCTMQACSFRDMYPQIEEQNGVVLGVSGDGVESHRKFKTKHNLPFLLLADEDRKLAAQYGLGRGKLLGIPLPFPERAQFVIDEEGCIAAIERQVNPMSSASKALEAIL